MEFFQYLWLIWFWGIIGVIIKHFLDKEREKMLFKVAFEKEEFFKLQEKLEIVFNWLNFYNSTIKIISRNIQDWNHFEQDFTSNEINKRMWENYQKSQELLFLYFHNLYEDFWVIIELYNEVVNFYFEKILWAQRSWLNLNYTNEDTLKLVDKLNNYTEKQFIFLNKLKQEINKKRDALGK